ncbi:MAG: PLP-dependent aminotransferase family protein [Tepidisphaeraceae bacterium]
MPPQEFEQTLRVSRAAGRLKPSSVREILKMTESPEVISFAGGLPAPELFPVNAIARACQAVMATDGPAALQYGVTEGYRPLREWVADHLGRTVGLARSAEDVLITGGSQQALDLVARTFCDPGDVVLTDDPAYLGALQAFAAAGARCVGVPGDEAGMSAEALSQRLSELEERPKLIYLTPTFQNPTGLTVPLERRRELARVAAEAGVPILEDDPYGPLRYAGEPVPALASLPEAGQVMYLGTSSKILAPGLRVAWLVTPGAAIREKIIPLKQAADLHTSGFTQRVVHRYVSEPAQLSEHLSRLRQAYGERREAMLAALSREMPAGCTWTKPQGGLFLWMRVPDAIDTLALLHAAMRERVAFVPGASFWVSREDRRTMRLNFSHPSVERIHEGVARLGGVIREALRGG